MHCQWIVPSKWKMAPTDGRGPCSCLPPLEGFPLVLVIDVIHINGWVPSSQVPLINLEVPFSFAFLEQNPLIVVTWG